LGDAATFAACECGRCVTPHAMAAPYVDDGRRPQLDDMHKVL